MEDGGERTSTKAQDSVGLPAVQHQSRLKSGAETT